MFEQIKNYLNVIKELMLDYGTDTIIFNNFVFYFSQKDWEAVKKFNLYSISWLDKQPAKNEIIEIFNLAQEYARLITKN